MNVRKFIIVTMMLCLLITSVQIVGSSDASDSDDTKISEAGFIEDSGSFFYYAKFAINGFDCGSSATKITPTSEIGKKIGSDILYAKIGGMDPSKEYYLQITEYLQNSTEPKATMTVPISGKINTVVWMSISDMTHSVYVYGIKSNSATITGDFTSTEGDQKYSFMLKTDSKDGQVVSEKRLDDMRNYCCIAGFSFINSTAEGNELMSHGVSYGYGGSSAAYAGEKIEKDPNSYTCIFFIANADTYSLKIIQGNSSYTFEPKDVILGKNVSYGYAVIPTSVLTNSGFSTDHNGLIASICNGGSTYCTSSYSENTSGSGSDSATDNTILYICIGVAAAILLIIIFIIYRRSA